MTVKRIRARSATSARNKAAGKRTIVSKVNSLPGTRRSGISTYSVTTHKKK